MVLYTGWLADLPQTVKALKHIAAHSNTEQLRSRAHSTLISVPFIFAQAWTNADIVPTRASELHSVLEGTGALPELCYVVHTWGDCMPQSTRRADAVAATRARQSQMHARAMAGAGLRIVIHELVERSIHMVMHPKVVDLIQVGGWQSMRLCTSCLARHALCSVTAT